MNEDEYYSAINHADGDWTPEATAALNAVITKHTPKTHVEARIRYIINEDVYLGYKWNDHEVLSWFGDGWYDAGIDGVASYPWMMSNCIVWVEERVVYEPEPWHISSEFPSLAESGDTWS